MSFESADRVADVVVLGAAAASTGFLPIDLETWALVLSLLSGATYYGVRTFHFLKNRNAGRDD